MHQTVSIGDRLREERGRLKMSQPAFGEAGGVTKKTQMLYESGERFPDARYLAAIAAIGVDVAYVVTGARMAPAQAELPAEHKKLIEDYEGSSTKDQEAIRQLARSVARAADAPVPQPARKRAAGGSK